MEIIYKNFLKLNNLLKTIELSFTYAKYLSAKLEGYNVNCEKSYILKRLHTNCKTKLSAQYRMSFKQTIAFPVLCSKY